MVTEKVVRLCSYNSFSLFLSILFSVLSSPPVSNPLVSPSTLHFLLSCDCPLLTLIVVPLPTCVFCCCISEFVLHRCSTSCMYEIQL